MSKEIDPVVNLCTELKSFDEQTYNHSVRVANLMVSFGSCLEVSEAELTDYENIGLLHDVGKTRVPDYIQTKPGPLTEPEMGIMRIHPIHSVNMIAELPETIFHDRQKVLDAVLYHHENFDGTGYPAGLVGENISFEARVLTIADVFDALTSRRCYKEPNTVEETIKIMNDLSGKSFDPNILARFNIFIRDTRAE